LAKRTMEKIDDNSEKAKDVITDAWDAGKEKTREAGDAIKKATDVN